MPTIEALERALELIARGPAQYDYFFDNLEDPTWIEPLRARSFFSSPPPPVVLEEGAMHPNWSESQFLLRMAKRDPKAVAAAVKEIPATENVRVLTDICRIGALLPPPLRLAVGKQVRGETARRPIFFLLPEAMGELIIAVAAAGESKFAVEFAKELLALRMPEADSMFRPTPAGRVNGYEYERLVSKLVPELVPSAGLEAMELAADLLQETIEHSGRVKAPRDYAEYWRPAIDDHHQNRGDDTVQGLVAAVRDAALALVEEDSANLAVVVERLRDRRWHLFTRIALYVSAERPGADPALAQELALDPALLKEGALDRERDQLLAAVFADLSLSQRNAYLSRIEAGPEIPQSEDPEVNDQRIELWQRDRLAPLAGLLPSLWEKKLKGQVERYGEPPVGRFRVSAGYWSGPTSPLSEEEMAVMPASAVIDFIAAWTPEETMMTPTAEGLARVLSDRVEASPVEFGALAERIVELDPTYVRAVLHGLEQAVKGGEEVPWAETLTLIELAVQSPGLEEAPEVRERDDRDPDWRWARKEAASLLESALQANLLPAGVAARAWDSLQYLSWDDEPDTDYERQYGGSNMDPLTLSLNTTRGQAMHAVVAFAIWARQNDDEESLGRALSNLDEHLDPALEPSLTVRGVFGARLHQLRSIAPLWLAERVGTLFPAGADLRALRLAAWDTYLVWGRPSPGLFEILEPQYLAAIEELPVEAERKEAARRDPTEALAEHLATFLWWGAIGNAPDGLAERFFKAAEPKEAGHLLEVLGRSLREQENEPIPRMVMERLENLWAAISGWISARPRAERSVILSGFGELYASGSFDEAWADRELLRLAGEGVLAGAEHVVFDRLVARASLVPETALRFALAFVEDPPKAWSIDAHEDDLRAIIEASLAGPQRELAVRLINRLVAKGQRQYRDYLQASVD